MIFPVATIISYISRHIRLEAGDIIATGTPEGIAPISRRGSGGSGNFRYRRTEKSGFTGGIAAA
jgi:2-keto-4-pentenoate hydratase/2-oxohepta-3-ene-1,7-dioic acid hydratase in catechol pathway